MGLLSKTSREGHERLEAEFGWFVAKPCSAAGGRGEAEDADLPAQQNWQNIKPNIAAAPTLSRPTRQPRQGNLEPGPAILKSTANCKKSAHQDKKYHRTHQARGFRLALEQDTKN